MDVVRLFSSICINTANSCSLGFLSSHICNGSHSYYAATLGPEPLSHGVMLLLKLWAALPSTHEFHITTKQLAAYKGFVRSGAIQVKASLGEGKKTKKKRKGA